MAHYLSTELQSLLIGVLGEPLQQTICPNQPPGSSIMQNWSTGRLCAPSVGPTESAALRRRDERECKMLLIGLDAHRGQKFKC